MPRRIDKLTDAHRATFAPYAAEWIDRGHRTGTMTDSEWEAIQAAIRACYRYAGQAEPRVIVRVPSPFVGAVAAPLAAHLLQTMPVYGKVRGAVDAPVAAAVGDAVDISVYTAVGGAVDDAVYDAVDAPVGDVAMGDAVDDAVRDAVDRTGVADLLRAGRYNRFGGQHYSGWLAWRMWFRDCAGLELDGDLWDRAQAFADANTAGCWWVYRDFVMVADRPTELHLEQVAPTGWGSHRLHRPDGPAVAWADGTAVYAWHGTRVPADLIETGWDTQRILAEPNAEIRRCAIERLGWDRFVDQAGLTQVGQTVPDPGNPSQYLSLHDVPGRIYGVDVRVLLCTNGTVERDGTRRRFGLTVPADITDPIAAAAWGYGVTPELYATAARRA